MIEDTEIIQTMFQDYLSSNLEASIYRITVTSLDESKSSIVGELTLLDGETYCCSEATCHFKPNWDRIREIASVKNLSLSKPLSIELMVNVESGANITTNLSIDMPIGSKAFSYTEKFREKT